jgi:hypothetical protein
MREIHQPKQPYQVFNDIAVTVPRGAEAMTSRIMTNDSDQLTHDQYILPEVLANIKPVQYNGLVASLLDVEYIGDMPNLILGVTDFRLHSASINNPAAGARAEIIAEGLPQGLINTARITVSDGSQLASIRNIDGLIGTVGGMFSPKENIQYFGSLHAFNPYAAIILELWEEIGVWSELWCEQNGNYQYLIQNPEVTDNPTATLLANIAALELIIQDFDIKISSILRRGSPLNVPLIIFDIQLNNTFLELFQLHLANRNNELLQLMNFNPQELMPWQAIQRTSPALQMAYPNYFPSTGDYSVTELIYPPSSAAGSETANLELES